MTIVKRYKKFLFRDFLKNSSLENLKENLEFNKKRKKDLRENLDYIFSMHKYKDPYLYLYDFIMEDENGYLKKGGGFCDDYILDDINLTNDVIHLIQKEINKRREEKC